ncbi:MAG: hypothetical protein U0670_15560 [Anaerolineae bacterium]
MSFLKNVSAKLNSVRYATVFFAHLLATPSQRAYAWRWLGSQRKNYLLNHAMPWIVFGAIDFLDECLKTCPNPRVFEYGSGGSTLYWLRKGAACVSVEHDPVWCQIVQARLSDIEKHVDLRLIEADAPTSNKLDPANPADFASADLQYLDRPFKQYVQQIDPFPDNTFDFILIDGRARTSCLLHSLSKVKPGGYIILDNSDRDYYTLHFDLSAFEEYRFDGVPPVNVAYSRTSIYQRKV